jgi:uncharacterized membrane protein
LRRVPWNSLPTALVALHVLANVVWIGSILSVALLSARAPFVAEAAEDGALARRVYTRLAAPAFLVSFAAGAGRLSLQAGVYLHMPWMHAKLTCALAVIAIHHVVGARCRRIAGGRAEAGRGMPALAGALFLAAAGAVLLGVYKSLP